MRYKIIMLLIVGLGVLTACGTPPVTSMSEEQLVAIIQTPDSPEFLMAVAELGNRGTTAASTSLVLAKALQYPRRDAYVAAEALIKIGPAAKEAIPELINALQNERPEVRANAAIVLGVIGKTAQCAVPDLAKLLWDNAPEVRGSSSRALDAITEADLVEEIYKLTKSTSIIYDDENRPLSERARPWWVQKGQYKDWTHDADNCHKSIK